ncbi:MAG: hypothetical protein EG825_15520 [Rhodocyclaceae bacterium]|nr:hypothetical protein [Rhodocyclaceae bacterium]
MPKQVPAHELDQIADQIGRYPDGVGLDALTQALGAALPRRTLQRRLAQLVRDGRLAYAGKKYWLAPITGQAHVALEPLTGQITGEVYVPLSPEGEAVKAYVRQALQQRRPVSYEVKFLEAYRPNETFYLSAALREQLHSLGYPISMIETG